MVKQTHLFGLPELEGFKLLVMPYRGGEASMLVLLPDKVNGLADLERSLSAEKLGPWLEKSRFVKVALSLPKFKNTSALNLDDTLIALGMKKAFVAGQADFTGIANVRGGAALHRPGDSQGVRRCQRRGNRRRGGYGRGHASPGRPCGRPNLFHSWPIILLSISFGPTAPVTFCSWGG